MATYTIAVTNEDIERGVPLRCDICPVALAARRAIGSRFLFTVDVPERRTL